MSESRNRLRSESEEPPSPSQSPSSPQSVKVTEMLKANYAKQREHEPPISLKKRKSRKKRDYVIVMLLVNGAILSLFLLGATNAVSVLFTVSGMIFFSVGFTWVMCQVINDY